MQFNLGGFVLGAGLVILHKKNPEILSSLFLPIKSLLSGSNYFSRPDMPISEEKEMPRNVADITKKRTNRAKAQKKSGKEEGKRNKNVR